MDIRNPAELREKIEESGHSYQDIAVAVDCSKGFIGHLAAGRKTGCTPELARRIAEVLDVAVSELFVPEAPAGGGRSARRLQKVA